MYKKNYTKLTGMYYYHMFNTRFGFLMCKLAVSLAVCMMSYFLVVFWLKWNFIKHIFDDKKLSKFDKINKQNSNDLTRHRS